MPENNINFNIKYNYHTHIYLCRHAEGDFDEYIQQAISHHYTDLGFSDHGPFTPKANKIVGFSRRMTMDEFNNIYLKDYYKFKNIYQNQINLHLGLEVEYLPIMKDFFKELLDSHTVEYLILGQHYYQIGNIVKSPYGSDFDDEQVEVWTKSIIEGLETGYFKILAHPDLFLWRIKWNPKFEKYCRQIIECCIKNNVYIEINANGIRNSKNAKHYTIENNQMIYAYPNLNFIKILSEYNDKAKVILGDDCHYPEHFRDDATKEAWNLAVENGIKIEENPII